MALHSEYPECVIAYCDTDSIYAGNLPKINKDGPFYKNFVDNNRLGAFKLEIEDKIDHEYAEAVFVMNKGYALRNPVTGEESITCKGVV
jgi:hypothetical protein